MGKIIRNGINYGGTYEDATSVNYDGAASGLEARTVQEAVDELSNKVDTNNTIYYNQEVAVGQLIGQDGHTYTIYEKSFGTALPNATELTIPHNIENLRNAWIWMGSAKSSTGTIVPMPCPPTQGTNFIRVLIKETNITIETGTDFSSFVGYLVIRYIKNEI